MSGGENETIAHYSDQFNGVNYNGDRVYVAQVSDNIGSYHNEMYSKLRRQLVARVPVAIW